MGLIVAMALGAITLVNWTERGRFEVPEDGIVWANAETGVVASSVDSPSPAAQVGVRPGDSLRTIEGQEVREALDVSRILWESSGQSAVEYAIERDGQVRIVMISPQSAGRGILAGCLLALGWAFGMIGCMVWVRAPASGQSTRFFAWCMASLAVFSLSSSGRLEGLDRAVYWIDVWALLLMPPLMLDFLLRFPSGVLARSRRPLAMSSYGIAAAIGAAHHAAAGGWLPVGSGEEALLRFFDTAPLVLLAANALAAAACWKDLATVADPVERQQIRWIGFGGIAAVVPFGAFYVIPFTLGIAPGPSEAFSVLSLCALPAACATALFRYRLLDFEPLWRRTLASSMAAGLLLAFGYLVLRAGFIPSAWLDAYSPLLWIASVLLAAAAYGPVRDWLVDALERRAYSGRYWDRRTLSAFAAELAAETDLDRMLSKVGTRLSKALQVERAAILVPARSGRFAPLWRSGFEPGDGMAPLEIPELAAASGTVSLPEHSAQHQRDAALDFWHYVPCVLRGKTLAWIALGRSQGGSLLSSEDLALAETVACPLAIALDNARLYRSLQEEAAQHQRLKEFNENIVESLSVGIIVTDTDGRVLGWNSQLELSLQISRERAIGRPLRQLLPSTLVDEVENCQEDSGSGSVEHFRLRASDFPAEFRPPESAGELEQVVNLAVAPLVAKDFRQIGQLLILDDVSERVELERAVREADRLTSVGVLAAGVAHEVNTPLAVISSYTQILAERLNKGSDEARLLDTVTEQTYRASEIVNSLLDFSRTSGDLLSDCDLDRTVRETLDLIQPQLRKAGVRVEMDLCNSATVKGNNGRLQQVLLNLFLNARDAMPDGGTLRISSGVGEGAAGPRSVRLLIADTGSGMAPEVRRRIFDPFFTTKQARRGTGLGLAVAYGIVQEHGGRISVETAPGKGTLFALEFPLAPRAVHA